MKELKIKVTFTEAVLGTWPNNEAIAEEFIASKAPDAGTIKDEIEAIGGDAVTEKGMTVFPRNMDGVPCFYDYQIKGMFKDSCGMLSRLKGSGNESSQFKAYKKVIDGLIFVSPRMIPINVNGEIGTCQRPLRAQTPRGERVSLAMSEEIPAGSTFECAITCMDDANVKAVKEWLDYGALRGMGQWRNSGKGRYVWEEVG